ncbi:hypothetical protein BHE74_00047535 [Ensete ventricosum]|nr:hypothetical protein BHE74_00047535 [Ensete ventricosum]
MAIEGSELGPAVIMEEEEGSSNVGYGYSATSWLQVEMVIVKAVVATKGRERAATMLQRCGYDRGTMGQRSAQLFQRREAAIWS